MVTLRNRARHLRGDQHRLAVRSENFGAVPTQDLTFHFIEEIDGQAGSEWDRPIGVMFPGEPGLTVVSDFALNRLNEAIESGLAITYRVSFTYGFGEKASSAPWGGQCTVSPIVRGNELRVMWQNTLAR